MQPPSEPSTGTSAKAETAHSPQLPAMPPEAADAEAQRSTARGVLSSPLGASPPTRTVSFLDIVTDESLGRARQPRDGPASLTLEDVPSGSRSPVYKSSMSPLAAAPFAAPYGSSMTRSRSTLSAADGAPLAAGTDYLHISLTIGEQQALLSAFDREDPDNNGLTSEQFKHVAGNFLASKTTSDPAVIFTLFDTNNTGRITKREFLCGYAILCKGSTDERIRYLFNMFDVEEDGSLGRDQLIGALRLISRCARCAQTVEYGPVDAQDMDDCLAQAVQGAAPVSSARDGDVAGVSLQPSRAGAALASGDPSELPVGHPTSAPFPVPAEPDDFGQEPDIEAMADAILDGAEAVTYIDFFDLVTSDPTVMAWLDMLAQGAGEYIEDMRIASESALREMSLLRANVIGVESATASLSLPRVALGALSEPASGSLSPPSNMRSSPMTRRAIPALSSAQSEALAVVANSGASFHSEEEGSRHSGRLVPASPSAKLRRPRVTVETQDVPIDYESITNKKVIGKGSFATVYSAEWLHMPVAVKEYDRSAAMFGAGAGSGSDESTPDEQYREIMSEIKVLTKLRHPNIVLYMGMCDTRDKLCIVSELYLGGSVHEFLHGPKPRMFSPQQALEMIANVARAMFYLHSKAHVLHRDLKASNILVNRTITHCVVCDFGLSRIVRDNSSTIGSIGGAKNGMVGTPYTMAPEVINGESYTAAADVYSFGIVAWEIWTGEMPFAGSSPMQIMYKVTDGVRPSLDIDKIHSQKFASLLEKCWVDDPKSRPNFEEIILELDGAAIKEDVDRLQARYSDMQKRLAPNETPVEFLSKQLMDVMQIGDAKEAARLLDAGANVNYADYDRRRPLHIAAAEGHVECVKLLIAHGARTQAQDRYGHRPVYDARQCKFHDIVAILESHDPDEPKGSSESALVSSSSTQSAGMTDGGAVSQQHVQAPANGVSKREEPDVKTPGKLPAARSRMRVSFEMMFAVHDHDIDYVRNLISDSPDVNGVDYDGRSPLHIAAAVGDLEIARLLVEHGADLFALDRWGMDPLAEARRSEHLEVAGFLEAAQDKTRQQQAFR